MSSTISQLQRKVDGVVARADEVLAERLRREVETLERENAIRADEVRVKARRNAERRVEHQARFSDAFEAFGVRAPAPADDERSVDYRDRLWNAIVRKLPPGHRMASVYADDLSTEVMNQLEPDLLEAAKAEGERPSDANLPDIGMFSRTRVDDMGQRVTEWFGKRSFIADLGRPGRRVVRLMNPKTGDVLLGVPFPRAR